MIDKRIQLTILESNGGGTTDYSSNLSDYMRDNVTLTVAAGHHLYIGYYKPINAVYAEFETPEASSGTLGVEGWDGAAWVNIDHHDETKGFSRSGFLTWDRTDMAETAVDGQTMYWVRLSLAGGMSATMKGLNLVFSDDEMLKREFPNILDPRILGSGNGSHITHHVAARNLMVQMLRNEGYIKINSTTGYENITQWDLLDIYEIREAATYLALSKIFFLLSDEVDDNWWTKHKEYDKMFKKTFTTAKLSIDTDDDGAADDNEKLAPRKSMRFSR